MANYNYVVNSTFTPFTMQEQLQPFLLYKEAFEETEKNYNDLSDKADQFAYLSEKMPEGSRARALYEGYANDLKGYAQTLVNGLSPSNRRGLTSMKQRYAGEIGRLVKADETMKEAQKQYRLMKANDPSMIFATDNFNIDQFLDGENYDDYSVSGNKLYERGLQIGAAISGRKFKDPELNRLSEQYLNAVSTQGINSDEANAILEDITSNKEFLNAFNSTVKEFGIDEHLSGNNNARAKQSIINGMYNGIVYKKTYNPLEDKSYISPYQQQQLDIAKEQNNIAREKLKLTAATYGMVDDGNGGWKRATDSSQVPAAGNDKNIETGRQLKAPVKIIWKKGSQLRTSVSADGTYTEDRPNEAAQYASTYSRTDLTNSPDEGVGVPYDKLPDFAKTAVRQLLQNADDIRDYTFSFKASEDQMQLRGDTWPELVVYPNTHYTNRGGTESLDLDDSGINPNEEPN